MNIGTDEALEQYLKERDRQWAEDQKKYSGSFCCLDIDLMLQNNNLLYNVKYDPVVRQYSLKSLEGPYIRTIEFCPWCGTQLMKCLKNEWFDILEEEYGLDLPDMPDQKKKIPVEFQTDAWWKKRGL